MRLQDVASKWAVTAWPNCRRQAARTAGGQSASWLSGSGLIRDRTAAAVQMPAPAEPANMCASHRGVSVALNPCIAGSV